MPLPDDQPLVITTPLPARDAVVPAPAKAQRQKRAGSASDDLSRELRLLTEVRAEVRSGNAAAALRLLERYRRVFPRAVLKQEADQLEQRARELAAGAH